MNQSTSPQINQSILKTMSTRQRARATTDLSRLFKSVKALDSKMTYDDFLSAFKQLQATGAGRLIIGRRNNSDRFAWNYNMREAASALAAGKPLDSVKPLRTGPNKPAYKLPAHKFASPSPAQLTLTLSLPASTSSHDIKALLELVESLRVNT